MFNVAREEVKLLDIDLKEIYTSYGTDKIWLLKNHTTDQDIDPLYKEYVNKNVYSPYKALGIINLKEVKSECSTHRGKETEVYKYNVKLLKSILDEQGVLSIDTQDKLKYGDVELYISSVKPHLILGNYCVQYEIEALGNKIVLDGGIPNV